MSGSPTAARRRRKGNSPTNTTAAGSHGGNTTAYPGRTPAPLASVPESPTIEYKGHAGMQGPFDIKSPDTYANRAFHALQRVFGVVGIDLRRHRQRNSESRMLLFKFAPRLGLLMILAAIIFIFPLFACKPEPWYESVGDTLPFSSTSTSTATSTPKPPLAARMCAPKLAWPVRLPLPACSPVCATLYTCQHFVVRATYWTVTFVTDLVAVTAKKLGVDEQLAKFIKLPEIPTLPIHRLGLPIVAWLHRMALSLMPPQDRLIYHATGFIHTAAVRAVAKLGIPDAIVHLQEQAQRQALLKEGQTVANAWRGRETAFRGNGPASKGVSLESLAHATCTSEKHLLRLMRSAQLLGLFTESDEGLWSNTPVSALLQASHPRSFKAAAEMLGGEQYVAMSSLHLSVRHGSPAFATIYGDFWKYHNTAQYDWAVFQSAPRFNDSVEVCQARRESGEIIEPTGLEGMRAIEKSTPNLFPYEKFPRPTRVQPTGLPDRPRINNVAVPVMHASHEFNGGMTALAAAAAKYIAADGDFADVDTFVDVAGGRGHLLAEILKTQSQISTGILFDLPSVYADAAAGAEVSSILGSAQSAREVKSQCKWATSCQAPKVGASLVKANAPDWNAGKSVCSAVSAPLCPHIHVATGSFFEPATLPRAHEFSETVMRDKLAKRLAGVNVTTNEAVRALGDPAAGGGIALKHHAVYAMMQILHDWSDEQSVNILKNLRQAMLYRPQTHPATICCNCQQGVDPNGCSSVEAPVCSGPANNGGQGQQQQQQQLQHGKSVRIPCPHLTVNYTSSLYVIDRIQRRDTDLVSSQGAGLADLLMMNNFDNARERYIEDMAMVLEQAGFRMKRIVPTRSQYAIVEAVPLEGAEIAHV